MARFQDWQSRMDSWLRDNAVRPFSWEEWGCCLMAASHVDNITGSAHYAEHAGKYSTAEEAAEYLSSLGFTDMAGLATSILGDPLDNPRMAQRGDIVTFDTDLGPALGVMSMCGTKIIGLDPSQIGFIKIPRRLATAAWRV